MVYMAGVVIKRVAGLWCCMFITLVHCMTQLDLYVISHFISFSFNAMVFDTLKAESICPTMRSVQYFLPYGNDLLELSHPESPQPSVAFKCILCV